MNSGEWFNSHVSEFQPIKDEFAWWGIKIRGGGGGSGGVGGVNKKDPTLVRFKHCFVSFTPWSFAARYWKKRYEIRYLKYKRVRSKFCSSLREPTKRATDRSNLKGVHPVRNVIDNLNYRIFFDNLQMLCERWNDRLSSNLRQISLFKKTSLYTTSILNKKQKWQALHFW